MNTNQHIANISLLVHDYDESIAFFTEKLGFKLVEDISIDAEKRWVRVTPNTGDDATKSCAIVLTKASEAQKDFVGNQAGTGVLLFLQTNDFWADYHRLSANGVQFNEAPREEPYATVVVFRDLYGNCWDLIQPKT